jgi:hypothetical protein
VLEAPTHACGITDPAFDVYIKALVEGDEIVVGVVQL